MAISGNPPRSLLANHLQSHSSPRFSLQASQAFFEAQARSSRCCPCQAGKTPCSKKVKAIAGRCAFAFLDEAEFHLNPQLTRMWMLRGEQVKVPSAGQNRRVCTFGALDWTTEGLSVMATEKKRSVEFVDSHVFTDVALTISGFACPAIALLEMALTPAFTGGELSRN